MKSNKNETPEKVEMYCRVGNIEQLDYDVKEEIENPQEKNIVALYIRVSCISKDENISDFYKQKEMLEEYCKKNNIKNRILYIDVKKSGLSKDRQALKRMKADLTKGKINKIVITSASKLYRDIEELYKLVNYSNKKGVEIFALDCGIIRDPIYDFIDKIEKDVEQLKQPNEVNDEIEY